MNFFNTRSTCFVLRNLRSRVKRRISQLIDSQLLAPVVGDKNRIRPNGADNEHRKHTVTSSRTHANTLAVSDVKSRSSLGVDFDIGFRALLDQEANAPRLISRK